MKPRQNGFTLIELVITAAMVSLLLALVYSLGGTVVRQINTVEHASDVTKQVQTGMEKALRLLRDSSLGSVQVLDGSTWVTPAPGNTYSGVRFQRVLGLQTSTSSPLSAQRTLEWVRDPRETMNGADDDGDGLVDEGFLRMTEMDGSRRIILDGVELFQVVRTGRRLTFTLQCASRDAQRGVLRQRAAEHLTLRNN